LNVLHKIDLTILISFSNDLFAKKSILKGEYLWFYVGWSWHWPGELFGSIFKPARKADSRP